MPVIIKFDSFWLGANKLGRNSVSAINKIYVNNGIGLDYVSAYDEGSDYESVLRDNFVGIVDARNFGNLVEAVGYAHRHRVYTSTATGFAKSSS